MQKQNEVNFSRIAQAIGFLTENFRDQPALDSVADHVHLSPHHFQRLFTDWAGVSPKKFLQFLTLEHAKKILRQDLGTVESAAHETGLSGTGRLHDLFVNIEGMTPGEYKDGGASLHINFSFAESPFGTILVASTTKGICHLAFAENQKVALTVLQKKFPQATYHQMVDILQQNALYLFSRNWDDLKEVKLHLKGSEFQLKVWEALLKIPFGNVSTYKAVANGINNAAAIRAVGTAIGQNPVAFIIPCHRVIQSSAGIGNYHWGKERKHAIIGWESALMSKDSSS